MDYRIEHDTMGEVRVPGEPTAGAHRPSAATKTSRSARHETIPAEIIHAFAILKKAAALANCTSSDNLR